MNGQTVTREQIATLMPHAGAMCLIDEVVSWDADNIECRSRPGRHRHPLAHAGQLAGVHLIEYGAQAAALHAGLCARHAGDDGVTRGVLAGVRQIRLSNVDLYTLEEPLVIRNRREMAAAQGLIYQFTASCDGNVLASGRLTIMQQA